MTGILLALLLVQVSPPASSGVVSGVVLSSAGLPAASVRVYAVPAGDRNTAAVAGTVFESLAQTDASGRYRLDVPAGRYYIAAGSVDSPTYYPNDRSIASAKVITVSAGSMVSEINFSRYVPATSVNQPPVLTGLPPGSTGVLSGVIRNSDGSPASGIPVAAVPAAVLKNIVAGSGAALPPSTISLIQSLSTSSASAIPSLNVRIRTAGGGIHATTDNLGRYHIDSVSPDIYYILAGFSDLPVFYPGSSDITAATTLTTTPTSTLDTLNFIIPSAKGVPVRVQVQGREGISVGGANLELTRSDGPSAVAEFLPKRVYPPLTTGDDGSAEFVLVRDGKYTVTVKLPPAAPVSKAVEIKDQPVNVELTLPIHVVTGRVMWTDGAAVSDPMPNQIAFSTTANPRLVATTILPINKNGEFKGVFAPGEYRVFIRNLPASYQIVSVMAGAVDLTKESFKLDGDRSSNVQIRMSPKKNAIVNVSGRITDVLSKMPAAADRVQICCFASGAYERLSTELLSDGSFQFSDVPAGRYELEIKGKTPGRIVEPHVEVSDGGHTTLNLLSSQQFANLVTGITTDNSIPRPQRLNVSLTFTPSTGEAFRITASGPVDEVLTASVPAGIQYDLTISGLPAEFKVKSLSESNIPVSTSNSAGFAGVYKPLNNASLMITLTRSDAEKR